MKLKKVILTFLIILLGLSGSLFGCKEKPLGLYIKEGEEVVSKISLILPTNNSGEDDENQGGEDSSGNTGNNGEDVSSGETPAEEETALDRKLIYVFAENANDMFKKGLDIVTNKQNIVKISLNEEETSKLENGYAYDISAIQAKNVTISFETKDKKTKVSLDVEITQDCEKIEKNVHSKNYVVRNENTQLSSSAVSFIPETTTNKNIRFVLDEEYTGLNLSEDGYLTFDENFDSNLKEFYVTIYHENYVEDDENNVNFVVENIKYDILSKVEDIEAVIGGAKVTSLEFATNMSEENYNFQTISFKSLIRKNGNVSYENIDNSYRLVYSLKNSSRNLINIKPVSGDPFSLTLSQNGFDGTDVLVARIENVLWPDYQSREIEIAITVKTYPSLITINGSKSDVDLVLYTDSGSKDLVVRINDSYNTNFVISNVQNDKITISYENGIEAMLEEIESGTILLVSSVKDISFDGKNYVDTSFQIKSVGNDSLTRNVNVRIYKSMIDAKIKLNNEEVQDEVVVYKTTTSGQSLISEFVIEPVDDVVIPTFTVEIEDTNVVKLENITYQENDKKFSLKALTTGETNVFVKFDNGLEKSFKIKVYTAIKDVEIDFNDYSKTYNIGDIENLSNLTGVKKYSIKNSTSSQILFKATDEKGNIVYDKYLIDIQYKIDNEGYFAISNEDNKLHAIKVSTDQSGELFSIKVTAFIKAYVYDNARNEYGISTIEKNFYVEIYEPIRNITLSEDYITLYTKNSLGKSDFDKAQKTIDLTIFPSNATKGNSQITFRSNFNSDSIVSFVGAKKDGDNYKLESNRLTIIANLLDQGKKTETGTITFSIQEYKIVYTKKVTIKISTAQKPESIIVENVLKQTDENGKSFDYIYFNLGFDKKININPSVYPITSLNNNISYKIDNKTSVDDIISYKNGVITPLKAGECDLILIPDGNINEDGSYENEKIIHILVADGESVPYSISTKQELLMLCGVNETENEEEFVKRFSKNYVLTSDIDLSGETIVPVGFYTLVKASGEETRKVPFSGTFSGKFTINGVEKQYSISGISLKIDSRDKLGLIGNVKYVGLFAENQGKISNLTVHYSNIEAIISRYADPIYYSSQNLRNTFIFGGISAINLSVIENCEVNINSAQIETYFGENYFGLISGKSGLEANDETNNSSQILNCFVSGNINICDGYSLKNKELDTHPSIMVGGIVGKNLKTSVVKGGFDVYNNQNEIFNKNIINSTVNITSLNELELVLSSDTSCFGGICGQNDGEILNMASYGKVFAYRNVGGVCGINNGVIGTDKNGNNTFGCFSASLVYGNSFVGGLCGINNKTLKYNAVMLLDDDDLIEINGVLSKIYGISDVSGLVGKNNGDISLLENNFVRSYVQKTENYYDIYAETDKFGAILIDENDLADAGLISDYSNCVILSNFADNLKIGYNSETLKEIVTKGDKQDIGITAPTEIVVNIKDSSFIGSASLYNYNKFVKAGEDKIVLVYYKQTDSLKYNYYLRNYLFEIGYNYESNGSNKTTLTKIESLSPDILQVDSKGNFTVLKTGEAKLKIYSVLNKQAQKEITIKVIDIIKSFDIFEDSLENVKLKTIYVEKGSSKNIYLGKQVLQKDMFIKYELSETSKDICQINLDGGVYYSTLYSQVLYGKNSGNVQVKASLFVQILGEYYQIPYSYTFNIVVSEGVKAFEVDLESAEISKTSFVNLKANVVTDLTDKTSLVVSQEISSKNSDGTVTTINGEFLNFSLEKSTFSGKLVFDFKIYPNKTYLKQIIGKTIKFNLYVIDSFVSLDKLQNNPESYKDYIKTVFFTVTDNGVINVEMEYYSDGEVIKNENGQDVINTNELESEFIKIGKIGILKINVYPKLNLQSENTVTLSYSNQDNYKLSFKQVKKSGNGYEDVNTSTIISNGIILDNSYLIDDENEQYLYVKLLTESPINENSKFNLELNISGFVYKFEKTLTSVLSSNLEIAFDGAILNSEGKLEAVYAKGVPDSQIISLTVNKLTSYALNYNIDVSKLNGSNFVEILQYRDPVKVGEDSVRYDYIINGINNNSGNESVELYFYIDKKVNNKTERYASNVLKLNIVDFVVTGMSVENVENGYLSKPVGTSYPLKVKLDTISDSSSEVLNEIKVLEDEISKQQIVGNSIKSKIFSFNGENLKAGFENDNFKILHDDYFEIKPLLAQKYSGFNATVVISYKNGQPSVETESGDTGEIFFAKNNYAKKYSLSFGGDFYIQTDINNPVPVYTAEEFVLMKENANYILMNDIVLKQDKNVQELENGYKLMDAKFNSLDGNGYKVVVKHLDVDLTSSENGEYYFGLFKESGNDTIIKNLQVSYNLENINDENDVVSSGNVLNLTNISNLTFGALCAVNNGLIYNCDVLGLKINGYDEILNINVSNIVGDEQTSALIGGMVGRNNGVITNSLTELKICVNKGFVGGVVGENNGSISSVVYKNIIIKNLGEDENSSRTAGFSYINTGNIKFSSVSGDENFKDNGRFLCDPTLSDYAITASTSVSGFVFNNTGTIEDCYANLSITSQSYSGGFVFANSGNITRSYAATLNEKENNIAHSPFIATKDSFDEDVMKTKIVDCYYLNINKSSINDNIVTGLDIQKFKDDYYLTNFILGNEDSVWKYEEGYDLPILVEANNKAFSRRYLYSTQETPDGGIKYSYIYQDGYYAGSKNNPIIISNEEEFIEYFSLTNKTNSQYYRLVNNINFSDYASLPTYNYIFSGKLDGNGLEISNLSVSAPSNFNGQSFGLFAKIEKTNNSFTPTVKNLTIKPIEVYANNVSFVGSLAGIVKDANIVNINVESNNVIVQGRNVVGGIVGLVYGNSNLINLNSNVSVNSNYSNSEEISDGFNLFASYYDENNNFVSNYEKVSYAGSICGIVDTDKTDDKNERVRNVKVLGSAKSIASFAGLAFGLVCENSGVDNVSVEVSNNNYLNSNYASGLVCGENRGYISRCQTSLSGTISQKLFRNKSKFIGGIVGFNNNGTIVNSISTVNIIGTNDTISAGGVVGLSVGGAISSVVASCDVWSSKVVGGIVGFVARRDMLEGVKDEFNIVNLSVTTSLGEEINVVKTNNIMYIANCVAINNFGENTLKYININDNSHVVGAIIGAAHNTPVVEEGQISIATKNSYIMHENYYKKLVLKVSEEEKYSLQDFGVNNVGSFDISGIEKNRNPKTPCASGLDVVSSKAFKNWSKNVFEIISSNEINSTNLPKLKSNNNINTKNLEGDGTYQNPYLVNSIKSINDLASIVNSGEKTNIFVNVTDNIEATGKEFTSIGTSLNKFNGTFNGNDYFINGLTYFNVDKYYNSNQFGLFGYVSRESNIQNINVVANFVINYIQPLNNSSSITSTGIIAGFNEGFIANSNSFGGMILTLKNITSKLTTNYIGGISGVNAGLGDAGILNCNNYATIYFTVNDTENSTTSLMENVNVYAGFIAGANINKAIINKSENKALAALDINKGSGNDNNYTLIVINNKLKESCKNFVNSIAGFVASTSKVYGTNTKTENIYDFSYGH